VRDYYCINLNLTSGCIDNVNVQAQIQPTFKQLFGSDTVLTRATAIPDCLLLQRETPEVAPFRQTVRLVQTGGHDNKLKPG